LLRARRQELHTRVATVLQAHFADLVERVSPSSWRIILLQRPTQIAQSRSG
jgi:hypothetical protein